ncbi:integrase domain-containing protein [Cupriavidus basilensis]|uniref:Integrase domain-containing protein n=1 Tax=Cupriavidus basilensis TaxID=68895 RepID=A0ABT6AFP0_9BURK|nr:integrase domain-containing protein [Cupriavidus basilensis]MDF3831424.1 integrase domain-containing protein [Cupriavidus basilensis]
MSTANDFSPIRPPTRRRVQGFAGLGRAAALQPSRRQDRANLPPSVILARFKPGKADPLKVLEVLLECFNSQHTSLNKSVSHKTRQERADFLRRFFRDLKVKAGFKTLPDPRNLGERHIRAMVKVWQAQKLAPATIQTYLSFLRGLSMWTGKHGFIRKPADYGLRPEEYQRHEYAQRDKSWSAQGVNIDALIAEVCAYDRYIGASLRLMQAFGLRRKESVMFRPHRCVVPFEATGLSPQQHQADQYLRIKEGSKGGRLRFVAVDSAAGMAALDFARAVVDSEDGHLGDPGRDLRRNLRRFDYVMEKFGITASERGITAHGLRHEALIRRFGDEADGEAPPVRGGGPLLPDKDRAARQAVAEMAGHRRLRAAGPYLGPSAAMRGKPQKGPTGAEPDLAGPA